LLPEHGYAFLRSHENELYWNNPDAVCAFLTYDRSGVHANADKLNLMLFGRNRMLLTDAESLATVPHAFSPVRSPSWSITSKTVSVLPGHFVRF